MARIEQSVLVNSPVASVFDFVVAEWQGALALWIATSVRGPHAEGRWEFAQEGAGTRFTYRLSYEMPPPLLGPILDRGFFEPAWRRAIAAALANLKRLVEARG